MFDYIIEGDLVKENYSLNGNIISKFNNVINIKTKNNKGYAITDSKVTLAPYHVKLPNYIFNNIKNCLEEETKIKINNEQIIYNKNIFNYNNKNIFSGKIKDCSFVDRDLLIEWTEKVIKNTNRSGSLDHTILKFTNIINNIQEFKLSTLQREFYNKLKDILEKKISINNLLGLGIGLTPTGDDFIVGYLSVIEAKLAEDKLNVINEMETDELFDKTNRVSALHLKGAINHRYNKRLVDIYKNIENGEKYYRKYTEKLIEMGNSSGLDMLSGLYFGLIM